nr:ribonuclease H-like domain-containing protein [Tanacetum cinerariifolium]
MDQDSVHMVAASKVPMLKPGEYELWRMRMEQCIQMVDYSLWEVIENEEKAQRRLELKTRSTLLIGIPNENQLKFNSIKDAKSLLQAVVKMFGRNVATKKDSMKSSKAARNKPEIDTLSLDDLYNNLKIYETEVKGTSSSNTNIKNIVFVSSNSTSSINGPVITAHSVTTASAQATVVNSTTIDNLSDFVICSFFANQPNNPQLDNEDLKQIHPDDLKEMDLRWQMAMLTMRARRFLKNTKRNFSMNELQKVKILSTRRSVHVEIPASAALVSCDGLGVYDLSDQAEEGPTNFALMTYSSTSYNSEIIDKCKTGLGYNVVPPPYTRNFLPPKLDLYGIEEFINEPIVTAPIVKKPVVETSEAKASENKPKVVRKNFGPPLIEDWILDSEDEAKSKPKIEKKTIKPSFAKIDYHQQQIKNQKMVKPVWNHNQRVNHKNFAKKTHPHAKRNLVPRAVLLKSGIVNTARQNFSKTAVLVNVARQVSTGNPKSTVNVAKQMSYLSKSAHSSVKRPIHKKTTFTNNNVPQKFNTVRSKTVNIAWPKVVVNVVLRNRVNAVKASACWVWKPKTKVKDHVSKHNGQSTNGLTGQRSNDSGCLRHMTRNMSYLTDYKEIDEGYVAFGDDGFQLSSDDGKKVDEDPRQESECKYQKKEDNVNSTINVNAAGTNGVNVVGKFDGKANEGFFVGYSLNSKTFRVFKNRTMIVEENLHVRFTWVYVLASKDETSAILKTFKARIENLVDHKVKVIRYSLFPIPFWAEAVNTACYVQNRVLLTKPHNKTPYELLHGRLPSIGFMRPFGCPVTILNTLDPLGKFQRKVNKGFLVGYSVCSKAFRVFNSRTCFGLAWLFDIDSLSLTMNYHPVIAKNQSNTHAGFQDTEKAGEEGTQTYVLFPVLSDGSTNSHNNNKDALVDGKEHDDIQKKQGDKTENKDKGKSPAVTITGFNDLNTEFEEYNNNSNDVGAEADINNLESIISVSPIPTTRILKDHPTSQIIGDLSSTTQTISMARTVRDQEVKNVSTPMKTQKPLLKDEDEEEVDVYMYRSMIGLLMYLTSSRYLKGQPKFGLWYSKDSPLDLIAYTDSDYAGASLDRKSTTREAEYVAASSCCEQATVKAKTVNGEGHLQALVDGKKILITKSTIRRDLQLEDVEGVDCLPNAAIFEQLTLMG